MSVFVYLLGLPGLVSPSTSQLDYSPIGLFALDCPVNIQILSIYLMGTCLARGEQERRVSCGGRQADGRQNETACRKMG